MTELLFYANAYLKNCEARVVTADERGIVLNRTVFYPLGGGQPGDVGSPPHPAPLHKWRGRRIKVRKGKRKANVRWVRSCIATPSSLWGEGGG